jgi:16S rRNA (adenine1518-N6/adenine1519-N6)-dimethyltransferase
MSPAIKKLLGQHFLRDTGIIDQIACLFQPSPEDLVVEIGAGDGALSRRIAPCVGNLVAIEIDPEWTAPLRERLSSFAHVCVLDADILKLDLRQVLSNYPTNRRVRILGNLPYYIATAIIEQMLRLELPIFDMLYMVQVEVAERITAAAGTHRYGYFSVYCQHFADAQMGFKIAPQCFVPKPKVMSAMVRLVPKSVRWERETEECFIELSKAAFAFRRKKVVNSLKRNSKFGPYAADLLAAGGISSQLRAENVSVAEYERLPVLYQQLRERQDRA